MKINSIRLFSVDLPIAGTGYQLSRGRLVTGTTSILVEIRTDAGISGWGESCPFGPNYLAGFAGGALEALKALSPGLIGQDPGEIDTINRLMDHALTGHIYAKSAIDIACWDLLGKATGLPLYVLLGGRANEAPLVRSSVNTAQGSDLAQLVADKRAGGFKVLTLKVGDDAATDAELTRAIAAEAEAGEIITADANGGWALHEAMYYAHAIADVPGVYIEQPCRTLRECLTVAAKTSHPIVLDESIDDLEVLADVLTNHSIAAVNLKIERVGGITKTRQLRDLCLKMGCAMFVQEVGGSEITYAATTHLAHTIPEPLLLGATTIKVARSIATGAPVPQGGRVCASDRPGLGLDVDSKAIGTPVAEFN